jgi:CheY-like chemotaxis protein
MEDAPIILVAEDDPNDVFFLRRAFQRAQIACQIVDVPDGQEAVRYLQGTPPYDKRSSHPFPHLLLLDLKMPLMGGFEVLEWMRSRAELAELPVLVLSSSSHQDDLRRSQDLGARGYLVKPTDLHALTELARGLGHQWLSRDRLKPSEETRG